MSGLTGKQVNKFFWLAVALRILAVIFSQGYAMHDDHFVIEDGPWRWFEPNHGGWFDREVPPGHSVIYPALMYSVMWVCNLVDIRDPQYVMLLMRLLHASWSLIAFPFVWRLAERYGGERAGVVAVFLFAVFWPLPFMSVRNLIEMASIPPLMMGWWYAVREKSKTDVVVAGIAFAAAFCFRYHTAIVPLVLTVVLFFQRGTSGKPKTRHAMLLGVCTLVAVCLTQGIADVIAWGAPFAGPWQYISSSFDGDVYVSSPWYTYIVLIIGIFLAPASLVAIVAALRVKDRRFLLELVVPVVVFVVAHSLIDNKQERFILPICAALIVVGAVAWTRGRELRPQWLHNNWFKYSGVWFLVVNTVLVLVFSTAYSKRSRVEAMTQLTKLEGVDIIVKSVLVVTDEKVYVPTFYAGSDVSISRIVNDTTRADWHGLNGNEYDIVVFFGQTSLERGKAGFERQTGNKLKLVAEIEPGFIDHVLFLLNPRGNKNETSYLYTVIM